MGAALVRTALLARIAGHPGSPGQSRGQRSRTLLQNPLELGVQRLEGCRALSDGQLGDLRLTGQHPVHGIQTGARRLRGPLFLVPKVRGLQFEGL